MRTKHILTLAEVDEILAAARNEAFKHNWVITIAVVDDGGHLLGLSGRRVTRKRFYCD